MKKLTTTSLFFLFALLNLQAQSFEWGVAFGGIGEDVARSMAVDNDGNVYTTGYFTDNADYDPGPDNFNLVSNGFFDVFLQKLNPDGDLVFALSFGGLFFDYATGVAVDNAGNIYLTGVYNETVDFDPSDGIFELTSQGAEDIFVLKLDSDGNFIWARSLGGPAYEESTSIAIDDFGNVYVAGYFAEPGDFDPGEENFTLTSNGGQDIFGIKLNSEGSFEWAFNVGGQNQDLCLGMVCDGNGNTYYTGNFNNTVDFDPGVEEENRTSVEGSDAYLLSMDSNGFFRYATAFGGTQNDIGYDLGIDNQGNATAAGGFRGSLSAGDFTFLNDGIDDAIIVQVNPQGDINWAQALQGTGFQNAYDIVASLLGQVVIAGYFDGTADFDPSDEGELVLTKESSEPYDAFYTVLNQDGSFLEAGQFGGSNFIEHHGVGTDGNGNIYLAAGFQNTVDANPDPEDIEEISSVAFRDTYVIKLGAVITSTSEEMNLAELNTYPNPVIDGFIVESLTLTGSDKYRIFNSAGTLVLSGVLNGSQNRIEVSTLNTGTYLLQIKDHYPIKFVKQ